MQVCPPDGTANRLIQREVTVRGDAAEIEATNVVSFGERPAGGPFELRRFGDGVVKRGRQQLGHLADAAFATGRQAQRKQRQIDVFLPRDRVADRFGKLGLAGAHIAGENYQRRAAENSTH